MKYLALLLIFGFGLSGFGQTIKSIGYNTTNGQVVANTGTNNLTFGNEVIFNTVSISSANIGGLVLAGGIFNYNGDDQFQLFSNETEFILPINFNNSNVAAATRANLGFSTNLNTLWTATNASNARSAVGLDATNSVTFQRITVDPSASAAAFRFGTNLTGLWSGADDNYSSFFVRAGGSSLVFFETNRILFSTNVVFDGGSSGVVAAQTRTNLGLGFSALTNTNASNFRDAIGLGATNMVTFSNVVNNGNFTNNNGTIYGLKTNVGPFEGIGNFFASNNTIVGNETLFRVGTDEANNKSAQFGFRVARTNNGGEGLAVFSVFGYNALMMIGPSDRSRSNSLTNTNAAIEADIWTMSETNRVMTLRDTNTGAMVMHRPIGINTDSVNTNVPSNTTNVAGWIEFYVGTNSVRVPYYQ